MNDPVCVVTGAARGIGRAIAERLLEDGWRVVALDLNADVPWLADHLRGAAVVPMSADATSESDIQGAADAAETAGTLAGWVNNAAVFVSTPAASTSVSDLRHAVTVNLDAAIIGSITAAQRFVSAGTPGAIVNVSSLQARQSVPGWVAYATAKAGIEGLTRSLAVDLAPHAIRVNAVAPGTVATDGYEDWLASATPHARARIETEMARLHPLGRVARPAEVAATVAYLLSNDASFVTGATIPIDGGRSVITRDPER